MCRLINADAIQYQLVYKEKFMQGTGMEELAAWKEDIDAMPTVNLEQRWIPCEERVPEDDTLMLVTYIDHRPDAGDVWIGWHEMENVWYIDGEEHSKERGNEVLAWMPLPEPYREGEAK